MRIRLSELRNYLSWQLLEVADVGALASRGLKNCGIVDAGFDGSGEQDLIAISLRSKQQLGPNNLPRVLGAVSGEVDEDNDGNQYFTLTTLYADDPSSMVVLLAAALSKWKIVVPDFSVSPAAQGVLKRYYQLFKDDPSKIKKLRKKETPTPWLHVAYLGPVDGFDVKAAESSADEVIQQVVGENPDDYYGYRDVVKAIRQISIQGFRSAYANPDKTGHRQVESEALTNILRQVEQGKARDDSLTMQLCRALRSPEGSYQRYSALTWYDSNKAAVERALKGESVWQEHGRLLLADPDA